MTAPNTLPEARPLQRPPRARLAAWAAAAAAATALCAGGPAAAGPTLFFELAAPQKDLNFTTATGINNKGQAVGYSTISGDNPALPRQAVFWGGPVASPVTLPGTKTARGQAMDINAQSQIVGGIAGSATRWSPSGPGPVYGAPQTLAPLPGGQDFGANGINDAGTVIGNYWKCKAADCSTGNDRAWMWDATNGMQSIGLQTGYWTDAVAINKAGDVLLTNTTAANEDVTQIREASGSVIDVPLVGRVTASYMDMNDSRQIAASRLVGGGPYVWEGFVWDHGVERLLTPLAVGRDVRVSAINEAGWVVGGARHTAGDTVASLWIGDQVWDLNSLLSSALAADWQLEFATDINDFGWLVGHGRYQGGETRRAFMMVLGSDDFTGVPGWPPGGQVPEPMTLALALSALGMLALRRRPPRRA